MLIGASQLFEQLPFAMENESVDSDLSGSSLKVEPSTSGTAAIVSIPFNYNLFWSIYWILSFHNFI